MGRELILTRYHPNFNHDYQKGTVPPSHESFVCRPNWRQPPLTQRCVAPLLSRIHVELESESSRTIFQSYPLPDFSIFPGSLLRAFHCTYPFLGYMDVSMTKYTQITPSLSSNKRLALFTRRNWIKATWIKRMATSNSLSCKPRSLSCPMYLNCF